MPSKKDNTVSNFAAKMAELEDIVSWFEEDNINIDDSLQKFERGMKLAEELKEHLDKAEVKVKKIQASFNAD